jgi:hypothetical protein
MSNITGTCVPGGTCSKHHIQRSSVVNLQARMEHHTAFQFARAHGAPHSISHMQVQATVLAGNPPR